MKKAIAIIVVIAIVLVGVGGYLVWKGYNDGYFTPDYISKEYEVEDFDNININLESSDVLFKKASDGKAKVECQELEKLYHEVKVEDNTLIITQVDNLEQIEKWFVFTNLKVTIYLPKDAYDSLKVNTSAGNCVSEELAEVNKLNVEATTGNVKIKNMNVLSEFNAQATTGNVEIENVNAPSANLEATTGNVKMTNFIVNGDLNVTTSTGNIKLTDIDATGTMNLHASTGNIKGTVLTAKTFMASSSTGTVHVPFTTGPICKIETSTGNIEISIKQ